jgi:hypothetical protein
LSSESRKLRGFGQPQALTSITSESDQNLIELLNRLRTTTDRAEVASLSDKIERLVFHKQAGVV